MSNFIVILSVSQKYAPNTLEQHSDIFNLALGSGLKLCIHLNFKAITKLMAEFHDFYSRKIK